MEDPISLKVSSGDQAANYIKNDFIIDCSLMRRYMLAYLIEMGLGYTILMEI